LFVYFIIFRLLYVCSPLLTESRLISFPMVTEMFHFTMFSFISLIIVPLIKHLSLWLCLTITFLFFLHLFHKNLGILLIRFFFIISIALRYFQRLYSLVTQNYYNLRLCLYQPYYRFYMLCVIFYITFTTIILLLNTIKTLLPHNFHILPPYTFPPMLIIQ